MPTVDIPAPRNPASGDKGAFGTGIPMPLLLIGIGGGLGLIVLLTRKANNSGEETDTSSGTLLPNTAIMLGSLQQQLLELQGKVTMGDADLSSQLTGTGENLAAQLDTQSAGIANQFADLNTKLTDSFGTIQGNEDALASIITDVGTQNTGLADQLHKVSSDISTANLNVTSVYSVLGSITQAQNQMASQIGALGQVKATPTPNANLNPYTNSSAVLSAARMLDPNFNSNTYMAIMGDKAHPSSVEWAVKQGSGDRIKSWAVIEPTFLRLAGAM